MTIEALVEKYIELCNKHGLTNVKSIVPIEYRLNTGQPRVMDGVVKMKVTTYTGKTVMVKHIDGLSYADNLQTLKAL